MYAGRKSLVDGGIGQRFVQVKSLHSQMGLPPEIRAPRSLSKFGCRKHEATERRRGAQAQCPTKRRFADHVRL